MLSSVIANLCSHILVFLPPIFFTSLRQCSDPHAYAELTISNWNLEALSRQTVSKTYNARKMHDVPPREQIETFCRYALAGDPSMLLFTSPIVQSSKSRKPEKVV